MDNSQVSVLKDLLFSNACYSFSWQNYVDPTWLNEPNKVADAIKIQELIEKIDIKRSHFLQISDYYRSLESNDKLKNLLKNQFLSLPDKLLKSNSAKGHYLYYKDKNNQYVVTDPKWFFDLLDSCTHSEFNSNDIDQLNNIIGDSVPILTRQFFNNLIKENKVI